MRFHAVVGGLAALAESALASEASDDQACRCFPGDACWPSPRQWDSLNATVGGRLIKTVPIGSPCHAPTYDEALCDELQSQWLTPPVHINSSSSVQAAIFANGSCDPFAPQGSGCQLGNYVRYAVEVAGPDDIAATLRFAEQSNIRLVIRNTGHDYMGRSTGAGGLAIWTHGLKSVEVVDWSDAEYTGKAVKVGAGTEAYEVSEVAQAAGLVVVTGECPTVGLAGGYTQSGGHSPLSTAFGLSADNTLAFDVVTADGRLVTATASSEYADLFWALSGSGSGNFGVVVSVTLRAHPDAPTTGASFTVDRAGALDVWHAALPAILDAGTAVTYYSIGTQLVVYSITGYDRSPADLQAALAPLAASMATLGVDLQPEIRGFASYHDFYWSFFGPLPAGHFGESESQLMGGRLLSRDILPSVGAAINETLQLGVMFVGQSFNVSRFDTPGRRAVLPQWRNAAVMSAYALTFEPGTSYQDIVGKQDFITHTVMPIIEAVTPDAGAYINEADFQQPDWQDTFYGSNYPQLLEVKKKFDPHTLFYNSIGVGSEGWAVRDDGRLCRA